MNKFWRIVKAIFTFILSIIGAFFTFITFHPTFGGSPTTDSKKKIKSSKNYDGERFINIENTQQAVRQIKGESRWSMLAKMFNPPAGKNPQHALPSQKLQADKLQDGDFVWLGHSSVLFKSHGKIFITDPVFYRASPIPFTVNPFAQQHKTEIVDLPIIDAVLISHDHYDHLDYQSIKKLKNRAKHFYVPLGVKAHLQRWGVDENNITELDWYESSQLGPFNLTLTPSRHFSGRNFNNRNSTLWGSWVVKAPNLSLYFSGDSGYGKHFAEIGQQYGPFDLALIEDGAYNERWSNVHMMPEQSAQAANDLQANAVLPIHWGKFDLAFHQWKEPIERFLKASNHYNFTTFTPKIGEIFNPKQTVKTTNWWKEVN